MGICWCSPCGSHVDSFDCQVFFPEGDRTVKKRSSLTAPRSIIPATKADNVSEYFQIPSRLISNINDTEDAGRSPYPQTPPMLLKNSNSLLLGPVQMLEIRRALPAYLRHNIWRKVFSFEEDAAANLESLSASLKGEQSALFVLRINDGSLLGALVVCPEGWRVSSSGHDLFGSPDSFLFSLPPCTREVQCGLGCVRQSSSRQNNYNRKIYPKQCFDSNRSIIPSSTFISTEAHERGIVLNLPDLLRFGGYAGSQALWIDAELTCGGYGPCPWFSMSTPLPKCRLFDILGLEAWVFSGPNTNRGMYRSSPSKSRGVYYKREQQMEW